MSLSGEEETTECSTTRSVAAWCRSAPRWLCSRSWWSRQNYADYQRYTCSAEQSTEANMFGAQQESVRQHGARYVDDVTAVTINGDRATATVKYHYEKDPNGKDSTPLTFARQDGQWKVCSAYR